MPLRKTNFCSLDLLIMNACFACASYCFYHLLSCMRLLLAVGHKLSCNKKKMSRLHVFFITFSFFVNGDFLLTHIFLLSKVITTLSF